MTQLRCLNWDSCQPMFDNCSAPPPGGLYTPTFEKLSEGFTAIRLVEGGPEKGACGACYSPPPGPIAHAPLHPYTWDTPLFTWTDEEDEVRYQHSHH